MSEEGRLFADKKMDFTGGNMFPPPTERTALASAAPRSEPTAAQKRNLECLQTCFVGCYTCGFPSCFLLAGVVMLALNGVGLVYSLSADPSKDFRIIDGACTIGVVYSSRETFDYADDAGNYESSQCQEEYHYEVCLPGVGDFKTYPAGTSPIELCRACTDSHLHGCVEGEPAYWSCIAALPCLQKAKWNQHKQLDHSLTNEKDILAPRYKHFDCEVAIRGVSGERACEGFGYDKKACASVGCCQYAECPIGSALPGTSGECQSAVKDGDCVKTEFKSKTKSLPSCKNVSFPSQRMSQRRLGKAGPDCFASKVDTKILDGCQGCGSCGYVATKPSFSEGDEVTCWAPAHERVRRLPSLLWYSPEYPYTCGNSDCYKIHE